MPEPTYLCTETGRRFQTEAEARASEARFREIQSECDAGKIPELRKGDVIYTETSLYVSHGLDDFHGGLAEVLDFELQTSAGKSRPYVKTVQESDTWWNWELLATEQPKLRQEFGKEWAHAIPDFREEFNRWD
jgi:hypothetical protein